MAMLAARIRSVTNVSRLLLAALLLPLLPPGSALAADLPSEAPGRVARIALGAASPPPQAYLDGRRLMVRRENGEWVALVLSDVEGRHPHVPWHDIEIQLVLDALLKIASTPLPRPLPRPRAG